MRGTLLGGKAPLLAALLLVVGCGGGGDGDPDSGPAAVSVVDYEKLCREPLAESEKICRILSIDAVHLDQIASHFRPPPELPEAVAAHRSPLRDEAEALYVRVRALA